MRKVIQLRNRSTRAAFGLMLGLAIGALSACDDLLDVDLPHLLTDDALEGEGTAETQVNSAIALYECGHSAFGWVALGHEDVLEAIAGLGATAAVYRDTPSTGGCDGSSTDQSHFDQIMGARAMLSRADERGVYDRIQNEWALGAAGERLSAISAVYLAASYSHFGQFFCEMTFDGGSLVTPPEAMNMAETWAGTALVHIGATDFAMPFGIANSATNMAIALRAQIRWAKGDATATGHSSPADLAAAAQDAATVLAADPTFTAWVTREDGEQRRNKIYYTAQTIIISSMYDKIDFWQPNIRRPNPVTGVPWAEPIIFTGYRNLGIEADGRAVNDAGYPLTIGTGTAWDVGAGGVADTRVQHISGPGTGAGVFVIPQKYTSTGDDIPMVGWKELRLIQAENENVLGNRLDAIAFVNMVRADPATPGLPAVTYLDATATFQEVRYLIHEERRRAFFLEGARYWSTKIQNTDISWFPRLEGNTPSIAQYILQGGVRLLFPGDEYSLNPNFLNLDQRGTGCVARQAPLEG